MGHTHVVGVKAASGERERIESCNDSALHADQRWILLAKVIAIFIFINSATGSARRIQNFKTQIRAAVEVSLSPTEIRSLNSGEAMVSA